MNIIKFKLIVLLLLIGACSGLGAATTFDSKQQRFHLSTVVDGLEQPWSFAFLPNGDLLITEKSGRLRRVVDGDLVPEPVSGVPAVAVVGQGGLLDIALDPDFQENRRVYLSYAAAGDDGYGTEVVRGKLADNRLQDVEVIFKAQPKSDGGVHFGSRLLFGPKGLLYITLGERGIKQQAQDLNTHPGSLIRVYPDGRVPEGNPFVNRNNAQPEIYTYGNRNMQGIALQPGSGLVWTVEHGPQGGDELNIMTAGTNYGWPVITYGVNYGTGTAIGEGTHKQGMAQPVYYWVPSIATSGLTFYSGDQFPDWRADLFVGSLKFGFIARLELDENNTVTAEERLLEDRLQRVRDIRQGPNGNLFVLDEGSGELLKLEPVE